MRPLVVALALTALCLVSFVPDASAQDTATSTGSAAGPMTEEEKTAAAVTAFRAAKEAYKDGKYVEALIDFKKAYDLKPTAAISYNIARCYEQLSQYAEAIEVYERFTKETDDARERTDAIDKIEFLKSKLAPAEASEDEKYKARIEEGKKAYSRGDYERAIAEFKAAFDISAKPGVLFNIAKAYERMARYEEAIEYYQQYLDLYPTAPDKSDVEETVRRLRKSIRERFQELSVSSNPPGADIYLDDRNTGLQGQTNYRFKVAPGPHTLYIDMNGFEPVKRDFVMPDDKPLALEFAMKKLTNVGYAQLKVNVDGARIFIDGAIIGLSPYKQKKALKVGEHQVTIEARGYPRYTQTFVVQRDATTAVEAVLEEYSAPVQDETLSKWGRNLMLIGLIGGGLGFAGPFAYQELILRRASYDALGPDQVRWGNGIASTEATFWRGAVNPDGTPLPEGSFNGSYQENGERKTLQQIQLWSAISGGVLATAGLGFYIYKWARPETKVDLVTSEAEHDGSLAPTVRIDSFGLAPTADGAGLGLSGSF